MPWYSKSRMLTGQAADLSRDVSRRAGDCVRIARHDLQVIFQIIVAGVRAAALFRLILMAMIFPVT